MCGNLAVENYSMMRFWAMHFFIAFIISIINIFMYMLILGFPGHKAGKECTCNAGELGWEDPLKK